MLWPHNPSAAYLPRHWACAIDVIELVATLDGEGSRLDAGGDDQRWSRRALPIMEPLIPSLDLTSDDSTLCSLTLKQAWGLTVRSERALRAAAPHWGALEAGGWGVLTYGVFLSASHLLARLVVTERSEAWNVEETAASLLQLLTSNSVTLLKVARRMQMDECLLFGGLCCFHGIASCCSVLGPACPRAITVAGPTIFFLLAPRLVAYAILSASENRASRDDHSTEDVGFWLQWMLETCCSLIPDPRLSLLTLTAQPMTALLHLVREEVEHSPEWVTPEDMDCAVSALSDYTESLVSRVHHLASHCHVGSPSISSQLRDMLAQPVLCLLGSPLLDQLAMMQHAPSKKWDAEYCPSFVSPLDVSDDDGATDIARQVIQVDPWGIFRL